MDNLVPFIKVDPASHSLNDKRRSESSDIYHQGPGSAATKHFALDHAGNINYEYLRQCGGRRTSYI